ncbi:MAG: hydrogenase iron-sulfur subunit [Desulfomonile sp.]|nr:hydrogenase iron-sulfur subunit [Deltaproteobacteria bacterium]
METSLTRIVVYHCRNLQLFKDGGGKAFSRSHPGLKIVAIPCSGKIEAHQLLQTLAAGAEGVLVLGCRESACQFLEGSMRSHKRLEYARLWLRELGMEPERLEFMHPTPMDTEALEKAILEFRLTLESFKKIPSNSLLKQADAL